jgi:hypothetical protein
VPTSGGRKAAACRLAPKCGEGGIRTPDAGITDVTVFETAAFNHSATSPWQSVSTWPRPFNRISSQRSCPTTVYLDLQFIPTARIISFPAHEPRPASSVSRALEIPVFCAVRSDLMELPVSCVRLTMNLRKTLCSPLRSDEVAFVREADPATFSATRPALTNKAGFVTFVVTLGRRSSCRLDMW